MYFDLNINSKFKDFQDLNTHNISGFCICYSDPNEKMSQLTNSTNVKSIENAESIENGESIKTTANTKIIENSESIKNTKKNNLPFYSRININSSQITDSKFKNLRNDFDLVSVSINDVNTTLLKYNPDIVHFESNIKKSHINALKENNIFIEVIISDGLYNNRVNWMRNLRKLLQFGAASQLVMSSGAISKTELKRPADICKILNFFGVSENKSYEILANSKRVLRTAALKTHAYRNMIVNDSVFSKLKEDFIINYHKLE